MTNHQDLIEKAASAMWNCQRISDDTGEDSGPWPPQDGEFGWQEDDSEYIAQKVREQAKAAISTLLDEREALVGENADLRLAHSECHQSMLAALGRVAALVGEVERLRAALEKFQACWEIDGEYPFLAAIGEAHIHAKAVLSSHITEAPHG